MDQRELRDIFGEFATGVTVISCVNDDGEPHGATVTAFTPISLDPPLCQVALTGHSKARGYLSGAPFVVNILAADQADTAMHFAGRPQLTEPVWTDGPTAPMLSGAATTLSCIPWREYDGGDHAIFIGEIVDARTIRKDPLLFHRSAFHDLGDRAGAAVWSGSADDPHSGWFDATVDFTPIHRLAV